MARMKRWSAYLSFFWEGSSVWSRLAPFFWWLWSPCVRDFSRCRWLLCDLPLSWITKDFCRTKVDQRRVTAFCWIRRVALFRSPTLKLWMVRSPFPHRHHHSTPSLQNPARIITASRWSPSAIDLLSCNLSFCYCSPSLSDSSTSAWMKAKSGFFLPRGGDQIRLYFTNPTWWCCRLSLPLSWWSTSDFLRLREESDLWLCKLLVSISSSRSF